LEIRRELRAQVELFVQRAGTLPLHIDGHQHVNVLPVVRDELIAVMLECRVFFTRLPFEPTYAFPWIPAAAQVFYRAVARLCADARDANRQCGIYCPEFFIGCALTCSCFSMQRILGVSCLFCGQCMV
jgi:predicted glycoside hydrolase/deacetylase ChbG (UPF0249 family)